MQITDVYLGLGQEAFGQLIRTISIGKLKTYQIYEGFKVRTHLAKVNTEALRKAVPRFWARIAEPDIDFSKDLAQAILVSHLDMITAILDFLGVPHENGFFAKDMDPKPYFTEGWEQRVFEKFRGVHPEALLVFYINHLRWELLDAAEFAGPVPPARPRFGWSRATFCENHDCSIPARHREISQVERFRRYRCIFGRTAVMRNCWVFKHGETFLGHITQNHSELHSWVPQRGWLPTTMRCLT